MIMDVGMGYRISARMIPPSPEVTIIIDHSTIELHPGSQYPSTAADHEI